MQISRHNYETFFLLYVDNELSATDKKTVDVFVRQNPDLQMELRALQQTVVKPDDIVLDKKDWLYMQEDITALQENLLLYADDELTFADKKNVEALLATNKAALEEWNILQQTKLQPDMAVFFADKQSLYKKESGRVVGFTWWRAAAAAVLLGFGLFTGISVYKNNFKTKTGSAEIAGKNNTKTPKKKSDKSVKVITVPEAKTATDNIASTAGQDNHQTPASEKIKTDVEENNKKNKAAPKENLIAQRSNIKNRSNNLPEPSLQNININGSNKIIAVGVLHANNNSRVSGNNDAGVKTNPKESTSNTFIAGGNNNKTDPNAIAVQVVNNRTTDEENNNHYLNVDDDKEKRTTLGGFIRKAKRVIERTTSVKTGEGIKIAGFEIALK